MLHLFQGLEIFPVNGRARFQPTLRGRLPRQACCVKENAPCNDAILQRVDVALRATARSLNVLHGPAVVSLAFGHNVTVHGIKMAVNDPMIRARVLVPIRCAGRIDIA